MLESNRPATPSAARRTSVRCGCRPRTRPGSRRRRGARRPPDRAGCGGTPRSNSGSSGGGLLLALNPVAGHVQVGLHLVVGRSPPADRSRFSSVARSDSAFICSQMLARCSRRLLVLMVLAFLPRRGWGSPHADAADDPLGLSRWVAGVEWLLRERDEPLGLQVGGARGAAPAGDRMRPGSRVQALPRGRRT